MENIKSIQNLEKLGEKSGIKGVLLLLWILSTSFWFDNGVWKDNNNWKD